MRKNYALLTGALTLAAGAASVTVASADGAHATPAGGGARPSIVRPSVVRPMVAPAFADTVCWTGVNDEDVLSWSTSVVTDQPVVASAVEIAGNGQEFFGAADIHVDGVAVSTGLVQVRVHTGWSSPLNICVNFVG